MIRPRTLIVPGTVHRRLERHLFPGDGKEAAAVLLCSRLESDGLKLLVRDIQLVAHEHCVRSAAALTWPGDYLDHALGAAETEDLSILLLHSHPTGLYAFSEVDDRSDQEVVRSLIVGGSVERLHEPWHGSAVMVPGGAIKARVYDRAMRPHAIDLVAAYGDDLNFYWGDDDEPQPRPMAFGEAMKEELHRLSIAVIGVSGTGSIVAEQVLRMGAGEVIVVDFDHIEDKNLNRILNSTQADAAAKALKVDVFKAAAARISPQTRVRAIPLDVSKREAIEAAAQADIVFSCVDGLEARHICDRLASAMLQPLFDVGVTIPVRTPSRGMVIANISGRIDYIQPGGTTLAHRGVYTPELLEAEYLRRTDPVAYAARVQEGYMPGAGQEAPAVICVNMHAASAVVLEFVARAYPYRLDHNGAFAHNDFDLAAEERSCVTDSEFPSDPNGLLGAGLRSPLLGLPGLEDCL